MASENSKQAVRVSNWTLATGTLHRVESTDGCEQPVSVRRLTFAAPESVAVVEWATDGWEPHQPSGQVVWSGQPATARRAA